MAALQVAGAEGNLAGIACEGVGGLHRGRCLGGHGGLGRIGSGGGGEGRKRGGKRKRDERRDGSSAMEIPKWVGSVGKKAGPNGASGRKNKQQKFVQWEQATETRERCLSSGWRVGRRQRSVPGARCKWPSVGGVGGW